jgi:uncharacterized protein (TIGR02588 family)
MSEPESRERSEAKQNDGDDNDKDTAGEQRFESNEEQRGSILEKLFTILSALLLLFITGYLLVQSFRDSKPPMFEVQVSVPAARGDFTAVAVLVDNTGDDAAKAVQVRGEAPGADQQPVEAEATMDWLPGKSRRHVTLLFPPDADVSKLEVKIVGYEEP